MQRRIIPNPNRGTRLLRKLPDLLFHVLQFLIEGHVILKAASPTPCSEAAAALPAQLWVRSVPPVLVEPRLWKTLPCMPHTLRPTHHTPRATRHAPHATRHAPHATRHARHVPFSPSGATIVEYSYRRGDHMESPRDMRTTKAAAE